MSDGWSVLSWEFRIFKYFKKIQAFEFGFFLSSSSCQKAMINFPPIILLNFCSCQKLYSKMKSEWIVF